jgi:uncharacterized protein (TIGR02145 family)
MNNFKSILVLTALLVMVSCKKDAIKIPESDEHRLIDNRDFQEYKITKIGDQTWMAQNLNYRTNDSWCYGDKGANCTKFGRLYTWEEALTVCPKGWHLPSNEEWKTLIDYLGGQSEAGIKMKSITDWEKNPGNNLSEFNGLPAGYRIHDVFTGILEYTAWWSATEWRDNDVYTTSLSSSNQVVHRNPSQKTGAYSCRCIKD